MSMTEQGTQMTQSAMVDVSKTGTKLIVNLAGSGSHAVASVLRFSASALQEARLQHDNKPGQTTISRLQERVGGDVHTQVIDSDLEKTLRKELNSRGINFAVEYAPDGQTYVHFAGKDLPSLEHAITQTEARLGIDKEVEITKTDTPKPEADKPTKPEVSGPEVATQKMDTSPTQDIAEGTKPARPKAQDVEEGMAHKGTRPDQGRIQEPKQGGPSVSATKRTDLGPRTAAPATKKQVVDRIKTRAQQLVKAPAAKAAPVKIRGVR